MHKPERVWIINFSSLKHPGDTRLARHPRDTFKDRIVILLVNVGSNPTGGSVSPEKYYSGMTSKNRLAKYGIRRLKQAGNPGCGGMGAIPIQDFEGRTKRVIDCHSKNTLFKLLPSFMDR